MGREIRRVALNFEWPLSKPWQGFVNPHYEHCHTCEACEGTGLNPATKQINDDWYDFAQTGRRWVDNITQDEVDALVKAGRLLDFTHTWTAEKGWQPKDPPYHPTAEEVNAQNRRGVRGFLGHDAINASICIETRAKRLKVYGRCKVCYGHGHRWDSQVERKRAGRWKRRNPPKGPGYQLWETVSEGSPISPVFDTPEKLAEWLSTHDVWRSNRTSYETWLKFIKGPGWAMSFESRPGTGLINGVEAAVLREEEKK